MEMMMPTHCKQVSVRRVEFELTKENIVGYLLGKRAFTQTAFVVLFSGKDVATAEVKKRDGLELFRKIVGVTVLSLPEDTVYVEDDSIDLLNRSLAARLSENMPGKTIVIKGEGEHISFVRDEHPIEVAVVDSIPPSPPKLQMLVERAQKTILRTAIKTNAVTMDLQSLARKVEDESKGTKEIPIMFPCRASSVNAKRALFLDECKEIKELDDMTLIGCSLSLCIYEEIYGRKPAKFINMCPREHARTLGVKALARCCKVKRGFQLEGNVATVPWGARLDEVAGALKALVGEKDELDERVKVQLERA